MRTVPRLFAERFLCRLGDAGAGGIGTGACVRAASDVERPRAGIASELFSAGRLRPSCQGKWEKKR